MSPGTRRRRGNRKSRGGGRDGARRAELVAKRERLKAMYVASSTINDAGAKETIAEQLAKLVIHSDVLHEAQLDGTITAEESRTLPTIPGHVARLLARLGIIEADPESTPTGAKRSTKDL